MLLTVHNEAEGVVLTHGSTLSRLSGWLKRTAPMGPHQNSVAAADVSSRSRAWVYMNASTFHVDESILRTDISRTLYATSGWLGKASRRGVTT